MNRFRGKLTYSNVVSTLCLLLLVGGGSAWAAANALPKNSVGSKQLKKGAVTPEKLSGAAKKTMTGPQGAVGPRGPEGARGERGEKGDKGDAGAAATALYAQIKEDGTVNASGAPVTSMKAAKGIYLVNFGRDITHCAVVANQGGIPIFETPGAATSATNGYGARVDMVSPKPGAKYAPGFPADETVAVTTFLGNEEEDTTFYVAALC
jgi:hypothetical protein